MAQHLKARKSVLRAAFKRVAEADEWGIKLFAHRGREEFACGHCRQWIRLPEEERQKFCGRSAARLSTAMCARSSRRWMPWPSPRVLEERPVQGSLD